MGDIRGYVNQGRILAIADFMRVSLCIPCYKCHSRNARGRTPYIDSLRARVGEAAAGGRASKQIYLTEYSIFSKLKGN